MAAELLTMLFSASFTAVAYDLHDARHDRTAGRMPQLFCNDVRKTNVSRAYGKNPKTIIFMTSYKPTLLSGCVWEMLYPPFPDHVRANLETAETVGVEVG
jgi:hypothetical protein